MKIVGLGTEIFYSMFSESIKMHLIVKNESKNSTKIQI